MYVFMLCMCLACCSYFATWKGVVEEHFLPADVGQVTGQDAVPFGDGVLRLNDGLLASETCEELFTPQ
jgi:NAD+ synthase (glutamine-hydrolysing)